MPGPTTRLAFLRAVNVGRRRVSMTRLVELFQQLGYRDVWTYINSGNVVFDAAGSRQELERSIEEALEDAFGFEVTTFVRTPAELQGLLKAKPFPVDDADTYFVTLLKAPASADAARTLEALSNDMDTLVVQGRDVHWRMHGKSTESSLKKKDWAVVGKDASTSRNVTMVRKLLAKLESR